MPFALFCLCHRRCRPRRSLATRFARPLLFSLTLYHSLAPFTLLLTSISKLWAFFSQLSRGRLAFSLAIAPSRHLSFTVSPFCSPSPCVLCLLLCPHLPNTHRKSPFLPRGCLEAADTHLGIPHEAGACTVGWLEKPTCLECLGPAVPLPLP